MNVLLISLQGNTDTIGLKYIHSYLRSNGYNSYLLFLNRLSERTKRSIGGFIKDIKPSVIGISLMSHEYFKATELTKFLKSEFSGIPVIWGGIHPTIAPEECIDYADYVCLGEGEEIMMKIVAQIKENGSLRRIESLAFKINGAMEVNPILPQNADIDRYSAAEHLPVYSFVEHKGDILPLDTRLFKRYARFDGRICSIITSRGCPFSCTYCCNNYITSLYNSRKIRRRRVDNVMKELRLIVEQFPGMKYINIQDDCFLAGNLEWLRDFADSYARDIKVPFIIRTIPNFMNEEKIAVLKKAGLAWVSMGLQSGSDRVCEEVYHRHIKARDFLAATKIIRKFDLSAFYDVILDNPFETREDIVETVKVLSAVPKPYCTQVFSLTLYKGTQLYQRAKKELGDDKIDDAHKKEYLRFHKNFLNKLVRVTPLLPKALVKRMLDWDGRAVLDSVIFNLVYAFSVLFIEPWIYFQTIRLSEGGSCLNSLSAMMLLAKDRIKISLQIYE